jgi:histidinol-phosphate aminotransferase
MSPTPVTFASPTKPASWSWEATNAEIAARYGLPIESIIRFDTNTSPAPPEVVGELLAAGKFDVPISEYPPSDYARLVDAAAARYGVAREELLVGAGADEVLDLIAKAFLPPGGAAVVPVPTYAMYPILTEQRRAGVVRVARRGANAGFALDVDAIRAAATSTPLPSLIWLCSPNNPTGRAEPDGLITELLAGLAADASAAGREPPVVALDEAYVEYTGRSLLSLRADYPRLVVLRTLSKAYGIAGLRVGFAVAQPELIEELAVYRPPGSVSVVSVGVATALLTDDRIARDRVAATISERERFSTALADAGWSPLPSVTNFVLVEFVSPAAADAAAEGLLSRGLIPRTFPAGHPLAHYLRLTVRNREQDDHLLVALAEMAAAGQIVPADETAAAGGGAAI